MSEAPKSNALRPASLPDGKTEAKTLVVTLQQARLKSASPEGLVGRWIIGAITDAGAAKP